MQYKYHEDDKNNRFWKWVAWRLPRKLIYWAGLRLIAHALESSTVIPELTAMDALKRWEPSNSVGKAIKADTEHADL